MSDGVECCKSFGAHPVTVRDGKSPASLWNASSLLD